MIEREKIKTDQIFRWSECTHEQEGSAEMVLECQIFHE